MILFGPTSPAHWGPPPGRPRHQVLDPGLAALTVDQVLEALTDLPTTSEIDSQAPC